MEINKNSLNTIFEDESSSEQTPIDRIYVEITYYADSLPSIKSYYIMSHNEYKDLKTLYMDLYIEDFINGESLSRDKLDIHPINNTNNIILCKDFLKLYGNPFDIIHLITEKKLEIQQNQTNFIQSANILNNNFSDTSNNSSNSSESNFELSEPIIKPKNKDIINEDIYDSDSEDYIETMTEIIATYNKSKIIDEDKIKKLKQNRPNMLNDNILGELTKTSKSKN